MNITRIWLVSLIVGLILLMNASSSHVSGNTTHSFDTMAENETQSYVILIAPVGPANMGIGLPPTRHPSLPEGFYQYDLTNVTVHLKFTDPNNNTLAEQDIVTPYSFDVDFKARGSYTVYVTNKGTEKTSIPLSVIFERNNPQNRESDKYLLSIVLTALGAAIILVGVGVNFVSQHGKQHKTKQHTVNPHSAIHSIVRLFQR